MGWQPKRWGVGRESRGGVRWLTFLFLLDVCYKEIEIKLCLQTSFRTIPSYQILMQSCDHFLFEKLNPFVFLTSFCCSSV